jgi:hypothetical protein
LSTLNFNQREAIIKQSLNELSFARQYRQGKVKNWAINEKLYYSRKETPLESRTNVDLGQMSSFVHTLLSKIDNPLVFKFTKRKEAQLKRVKYLNALRVVDQQLDNWDIKDLAGKKQGIIYGRAIYSYFADSENGYKAHLDNVDVYDFLIDPSAGGIDIERAMYMGRYGVIKSRTELKQGIKNGSYLKTETNKLLEGSGNSTESSQEKTNKQNRTYDTNVWTQEKEIGNVDKYKFWEWYTTYEGTRYYVLLQENGSTAIRVEPLEDLFANNLFPFWTWAAFPDLTEFWTPSYCDYVREIYMAEAVSINQMLDNAEQINKPQKVVQVGAVENLSQLKYRRDGYILTKANTPVDQAIQTIKVPSINTPIEVFKLLDGIAEKASGVTAGAKGVSEEDKVGIYEGNQANAADRFGLLNKSYSFGYSRFAKLWENGVKEHLVKKVAIDILGPDGVEIIEVSRRDIFRKEEKFGIIVEASNAELAQSEAEKRTKLTFLSNQATLLSQDGKPIQNPMKAYEISATIAGFDEETIKQLQDTSDYGDAGILSEAERDIEALLDGEKIQPNENANTVYKQRFVDYLRDNKEKISFEQWEMLAQYILKLEPIITRNMVSNANDYLFKAKMEALKTQPVIPVTPKQSFNKVSPSNLLNNEGIPPQM